MAIKIAPNFITAVWGNNCKGMLGMIFAPGRFKASQPQVIRNLEQDLNILKNQYKIQTLVSLIEDHQRPKLRITQKRAICERLNIKHMSFPIVDYGVPKDIDSFKLFVRNVVEQQIRKDKVVVAHCKAGLGRTGLFAGSCLVYAGLPGQQAVNLVRRTRVGTLQTGQQVDFVKSLKF